MMYDVLPRFVMDISCHVMFGYSVDILTYMYTNLYYKKIFSCCLPDKQNMSMSKICYIVHQSKTGTNSVL